MSYTEEDMKSFAKAYMSKCVSNGKVINIDKFFLLEWDLVRIMKRVIFDKQTKG